VEHVDGAFDKPAHASPTDTNQSHPSAPLAWVTFWVTQKVPLR